MRYGTLRECDLANLFIDKIHKKAYSYLVHSWYEYVSCIRIFLFCFVYRKPRVAKPFSNAGTRVEKPVRKTKLDAVHYLFSRPWLVYLHVNQGFIHSLRRFAVTIQCASKCNHSSFGGFCTCHSFDTRHRAVRLHTSCARVRHDIDVFYFNSFVGARRPTN